MSGLARSFKCTNPHTGALGEVQMHDPSHEAKLLFQLTIDGGTNNCSYQKLPSFSFDALIFMSGEGCADSGAQFA